MENNFEVGVIWSVKGNEVIIKMYNVSSDFIYFYNGDEYEGIRNGGYLSISRGHIDIVCQIESEEIKENCIDNFKNDNFEKKRYDKFVYAKCIGYFENDKFQFGIKYSPIIYNTVQMMNKKTVESMFNSKSIINKVEFTIGKELQYEIKINLPWNKIFNSHMGIFGNTGSGKSNTLTKLYTSLFNHKNLTLTKSKFTFIDFNGEYIGNNVLTKDKKVFRLNTRTGADKFQLKEQCFWNDEVLGILFHATEKTQKPFLKKLIDERKIYTTGLDSLLTYLKATYKKIFQTQNPKKETIELIKRILDLIDVDYEELKNITWHSKNETFVYKTLLSNDLFSNDVKHQKIIIDKLKIDEISFKNHLSPFDELQIRVNLLLINGVLKNYVQYDNINPLLTRISSMSNSLNKIIEIVNSYDDTDQIKVISLRQCNQDIKKLFPILLAKEYFREHKNKNENEINETFHLIIDEAHNILSHQSNRESESWKDYRLELFEEIIKEGRKFGFFLTISSQRPADISETIMSQFHNFFIHRLINDKDLRLIDNVISTLDRRSKLLIPTLPQGSCIITGTSFDFPQIIQVDKITNKEERPNSDDIDLENFWLKKS